MTLGFSDGAYNHASGTRDAFGALSDDLVREGHPPMVSRSGDREPADQLRIWHERMTLSPGSRKVYGRKWWQGRLWYQIHPDAVGIPDTSNHEKRRSNDLRAPYNADTAAARRAKVLAKRHNITREGEGFRELWHWTYWGPLGTIGAPAPAGNVTPEATSPQKASTKMTIYARRDDGLIVAIPEGGLVHNFTSMDEYEGTRNIIAFVNGQRQKHGQPLVTLPPTIGELVVECTMSAANVNYLIRSQGAESVATPGLDQIAARMKAAVEAAMAS